jgi:hypothetical protein
LTIQEAVKNYNDYNVDEYPLSIRRWIKQRNYMQFAKKAIVLNSRKLFATDYNRIKRRGTLVQSTVRSTLKGI